MGQADELLERESALCNDSITEGVDRPFIWGGSSTRYAVLFSSIQLSLLMLLTIFQTCCGIGISRATLPAGYKSTPHGKAPVSYILVCELLMISCANSCRISYGVA